MSDEVPVNFSTNPGQSPHKYFYNLCLQFKKKLNTIKDVDVLEDEMQSLINASKDLNWKEPKHHVYKKSEGEKILDKVFSEFKRYSNDLRSKEKNANAQDLLYALDELKDLIERDKVE